MFRVAVAVIKQSSSESVIAALLRGVLAIAARTVTLKCRQLAGVRR